jgi:propanol-preferring alcohol dehydrogenase
MSTYENLERNNSRWYSGDAKDSEETLQFSALSGILPQVETYGLEQINEAYDRMITSKARFRAVIVFKS